MNKILKDVIVCSTISLVAVVAFWSSLSLPPPPLYDPLGAGMLPRIVAVAIICLSIVAVAQSVIKHYLAPDRIRAAKPREFVLKPWLAVIVFGYTVLFAIMLLVRIPYWASSILFLFITMLTISRFKRSAVLPSAAVAVIFGSAVTLLFGSVFYVDLP